MGKGTDAARAALGGENIHADVIDDFKDQLLIACLNRLKDANGFVRFPASEIDDTGRFIVSMAVDDGLLFKVELKQ